MLNHCRKFLSIYRCSRKKPLLESSVPAFRYFTKASFGDYKCSKQNQTPEFSTVTCISEQFIKPKYEVEQSKQPYHLSPYDLAFISLQYINYGLLFNKPTHSNSTQFSIHSFLESLKESLSLTLVHFYPLAGQLVSEVDEGKHESIVYVDCNKGPGVRFIHATLDMFVNDIISPKYIPSVVKSLFDLKEVVNYDGHTIPLLSVQVTELLDGIFIACSVNHCIADGISYWQFWNIWSKIHMGQLKDPICTSLLPVYNRWYPDGRNPGPYAIPFTHPDEFVSRYKTPQLRERVFHFSSNSIARLKSKANKESDVENISSFQALSALVWRSIIRANCLPNDQIVHYLMFADNRGKVEPPLPKYYFGAFVHTLIASTTSGELLENNLGSAAKLLHNAVVNHNDKSVCKFNNEWSQSPYFRNLAEYIGHNIVSTGNSPRFDVYGNEFGLGKAVAFRVGRGNKGHGVVFATEGCEGGGSVDLEISLAYDVMDALELEEEFMAFVHCQNDHTISN